MNRKEEMEALADWLEQAPRTTFKFGDGEREIVEPSYLLAKDVDWLIELLRASAAPDAEEKELFLAITKTDLSAAIKHIRDWRCYIDGHHRQKYADLLEDQARAIAYLLKSRAALAPATEDSK